MINKNVLIKKSYLTLLFITITIPVSVMGERGDRLQPINIEADKGQMDDKTNIATFEGNAVLSQGTLLIKADTLTVKQENDEFKDGIAVGKPAYFRQKREGYDDYIEGEADRIEYDAVTEQLRMYDRAKLWRDGDEVYGDFISYDAVTEVFVVEGKKTEATGQQTSNGRVKAVIKPKKSNN